MMRIPFNGKKELVTMKSYPLLLHYSGWRVPIVFFLFICQMIVLSATPASALHPLQGMLAAGGESGAETSAQGGEAQLSEALSPAAEKKRSP
jgi:hypothetical protein